MSLRPAILLALTVLAVALAVPSAAGAATRVNVPTTAKKVVDRITARSTVPVYLPSTITIRGSHRAYASGGVTRTPRGWVVRLAYTRTCGGAEACQMASFYATVGGRSYGTRVQLARGIVGRYQPISCGASCSPAVIGFKIGNVLYEYSIVDPAGKVKPALIAAANQAIRYGMR